MNVLALFHKITTFIFDVDGVLTDGTVIVMDGGIQARRMNIKDGFALQMAVKKGYRIKVISGGNSPQVQDRLLKLGVTDVQMSVQDKRKLLEEYIKANHLTKEEVLYMGDDLPDIQAMNIVGLPCCPADAVQEVKTVSVYISPLPGGNACVRDVIEKVLKLKADWDFKSGVASN